eukprot:2672254-Prymnesium_polylepis.2
MSPSSRLTTLYGVSSSAGSSCIAGCCLVLPVLDARASCRTAPVARPSSVRAPLRCSHASCGPICGISPMLLATAASARSAASTTVAYLDGIIFA